MDDAETTLLALDCPACGSPLTLHCGAPLEEPRAAEWTCPCCRQRHVSDAGAPVLWITEGHEPPAEH